MRKIDPIKHAEKRREILDAARRCFLRSGLKAASISDICNEAGISPGHLYHYFESKEAIMITIAEVRLDETNERLERTAASKGSVVAALLDEIGTARETTWGGALLFEMLAEATRSPAMAVVLQAHSRSMRDILADVLRQGQVRGEIDKNIDPSIAAAVLVSIMDASIALRLRAPDLDAARAADLIKMITNRFLSPLPEHSGPRLVTSAAGVQRSRTKPAR